MMEKRTKAEKAYDAFTKSKLILRWNGYEWDVYAPIHGSNHFRWWNITADRADWYMQNFPEIKIERF
jgi:hypothetical protein